MEDRENYTVEGDSLFVFVILWIIPSGQLSVGESWAKLLQGETTVDHWFTYDSYDRGSDWIRKKSQPVLTL